MLGFHDFIRSTFEEQFGREAIIGVQLTPMVFECWITVLVNQRTQEMIDVAAELEREFLEEWGRYIFISIKRPWKVAIRNLAKNLLSSQER